MKNWKMLMGIVGFAFLLVWSTAMYKKLKENYGTGNNLGLVEDAMREDKIPDNLYSEDKDLYKIGDTKIENADEHNTTSQNTETTAQVDTKDTSTEQTSNDETASEQVEAPDITVYDVEGNAYKLSSFFGKPIVLNFWASWCNPCKDEMPGFQKIYNEYEGDIQFLMVNLTDESRETVKKASEFIKDAGYTFPVYYDTDQDGLNTYGVFTIPATFFIDAKGHLITYGIGTLDTYTLRKGLTFIYSE